MAIPGPAVESVASEHDRVLATKLVIPVRRVGETLALTRGLRPWTTPLGFGWK